MRLIVLAIVMLMGLSYAHYAQANFSGDVDVTSNYVWRGISLSNNQSAIQGNLTYIFNNGIYLNLWGSSVDFNNGLNGGNSDVTARIEVEYGLGYSGNIGSDFNYNLGIFRETYPGTAVFDYNEARLDLSYKIFNFEIAYSNNTFNTGTNGTYYNVGFEYEVPTQYVFNVENVAVSVNAGYYQLNPTVGNSYADFKVAISKQYKKVKVELAWTGTNGKFDYSPQDDHHVFVTVSYQFG